MALPSLINSLKILKEMNGISGIFSTLKNNASEKINTVIENFHPFQDAKSQIVFENENSMKEEVERYDQEIEEILKEISEVEQKKREAEIRLQNLEQDNIDLEQKAQSADKAHSTIIQEGNLEKINTKAQSFSTRAFNLRSQKGQNELVIGDISKEIKDQDKQLEDLGKRYQQVTQAGKQYIQATKIPEENITKMSVFKQGISNVFAQFKEGLAAN
jgi:chromosome segregation ATPase